MLEMLGDALVVGRELVRSNGTYPPPIKLAHIGPCLTSCRPELLHPFASAIDEPELKAPEEMVRSETNRSAPEIKRVERAFMSDGAHGGIGAWLRAPS